MKKKEHGRLFIFFPRYLILGKSPSVYWDHSEMSILKIPFPSKFSSHQRVPWNRKHPGSWHRVTFDTRLWVPPSQGTCTMKPLVSKGRALEELRILPGVERRELGKEAELRSCGGILPRGEKSSSHLLGTRVSFWERRSEEFFGGRDLLPLVSVSHSAIASVVTLNGVDLDNVNNVDMAYNSKYHTRIWSIIVNHISQLLRVIMLTVLSDLHKF